MLDRPTEAAPADRANFLKHAEGEPPLGLLLGALRRHWLALLLCAVAVPALSLVALHRITPRYTATGSLLYDPGDYTARELQSILRVDPASDAVMASQAEIVRGLPSAERIVDRFDLARSAEFNPPPAAPGPIERVRRLLLGPKPPVTAEAARRAVVQAVRARIGVRTLPGSRVMEVSFTSQDPRLAAEAANLTMSLYIDDQLEQKFAAVRRASRWLDGRVAALRREVGRADDRIAAYRAAHGLVQGVQAGLETERISKLGADLANARNDLAQAQSRLDSARGGGAALAAVAPSVVALRARQDEQEGALQAARTRLGALHPDVLADRRQLDDTRRAVQAETARVVSAAAADLAAQRARVATLVQELAEARLQVGSDAQAQIPLDAMQRDADAARTLLQAVLERSQQTAQQTAIENSDARVISSALPPGSPSFPPRKMLLAVSVACGLLFGLTLVYVMELGDGTLRGGADVRRVLDLPCLALIPELPRRACVDDYILRKPLSPFAEQVRALRAALWLAHVPGDRSGRVIAVTAARPAEGKTTLALSLGRSVAASGERVLVLDCDVREPAFGRKMGAEAEPGLMDCLLGAADILGAVRTDATSGMDYIPAGTAPANSLHLFMSDPMAAALALLRARYGLILLDAPPVAAITDARVIARLADATILCARWRHTPAKILVHSLALLEDAGVHVAGVALTRVDTRAHRRAGLADSEIYHPRYGGYFKE